MIIHLENFRCWKKKTFTFSDKGLVLLSGNSGSGKTSIILAIYFALYGVGTKIVSFGEKKCLVRLQYEGLDITRTKCPNRLLLLDKNGEYEDDSAQEIIIKKFGTNFILTSYITQKSVQSFLNLGPIDKMNFLEQLSLGNENISEIKKKVKERIREKKEILQQKVGQHSLIKSQLNEMIVPVTILFPLGKTHSDVKIKNEGIFWKRTKKEIEESQKKIKILDEEYNSQKIKDSLRKNLLETKDNLLKNKSSLENEISTTKFEGEENKEELINTLNYLKGRRELDSLIKNKEEEEERYNEMFEDEMNTLKDEREKLSDKLKDFNPNYFSDTEINILTSSLKRWEEINKYNEELTIVENKLLKSNGVSLFDTGALKSNGVSLFETGALKSNGVSLFETGALKSKLKEYSDEIETLQNEINSIIERIDVKCCPNCKTSLRIINNTLQLSSNNPIDKDQSNIEINTKKKRIKKCNDEIKVINDELSEINYLRDKVESIKIKLKTLITPSLSVVELKSNKNKLEELKISYTDINSKFTSIDKKIKEEIISTTLLSLKKSLSRKNTEIKKLKMQLTEELDTDYTEDELREEISSQNIEEVKFNSFKKELSSIISTIKNIEIQLDNNKCSERDFENELNTLKISLSILFEKEKTHKENDIKIKEYLSYKGELDNYNKWKERVSLISSEEETAKNELFLTEMFYKKIGDAESLVLSQTIDNINNQLEYYLDKFFPDNPITVQITPYKETKNNIKPQINIVVGYKGVETDVNSLSGGEYDRVSLSILLSLNTLFGSDIIMLDESISSLDSELTGEIIEVLKENMSEKLFIIVSHQIPTGLFDGIVNVDE